MPDKTPAPADPPEETVGQRLKRLRLEQNLSQRELAAPGVSYAYISRIEADTRSPSVKALRKLAERLGVTADYLETGVPFSMAGQPVTEFEFYVLRFALLAQRCDPDKLTAQEESALEDIHLAGSLHSLANDLKKGAETRLAALRGIRELVPVIDS